MALLGLIAILIAAIDIATFLAWLPFTSVGWSPLVFMLIGVLIFALESLQPTEQRGRVKALAASILGIGLLTACSAAPMPLCDGMAQNGTGSSIYSLASGDQLQIVVFRQPDLSGQFSLDGEGYLALPLVGEIAADGLSTRQLEHEIERRLKADDFLVSPQVGVQLATYRSFYVLGEVGTPGSFEYRNGMTVINAVALAGGYTARADQSSMTIGRGACRFETQADSFVSPGDIVTIDERFF